ncbi:MAG TPA: SMP-30/gluconolactonase/LRE family protein [Candidatus Acidoferrum sp.]|nr:SMP-30/gluconolactonase/LRE family protein [Candidatus Acidoferrum sp.]
MASGAAVCVLEIRSNLGEGPLWHGAERRLYWLDLLRPAIYRFDPASGRNEQVRADIGSYIGGLVFRGRGGWIVVKEDGISAVDAVSGRRQVLLHPEAGLPGNWFNDCKCDRQGRLWTGSADRGEKEASGNLYVIDPKLAARRVDSGIICSNGPAFSPDGRTAYFADSYVRRIYRYDIDPATGEVGARRAFATIPDDAGFPDGMTVDAEGFLWNAHWDGWRVTRYAPDGRIDRVVKVPVPRPTAPAFGGEDLATLYITSANGGLSEAQLKEAPLSGSLFACDPGVRGLPEPSFAG